MDCGYAVLSFLAGYQNERQAAPRQGAIDSPPDPYGLVEQLQRYLVDVGSAEHATGEPPGWRADLVQAAEFLDFQTRLLPQADGFRALEASLVAHSAVERAE